MRSQEIDEMITRRVTKAAFALLAVTLILLTGCSGGGSTGDNDIEAAISDASEYLIDEVPVDTFDSMGGGWTPFAIVNSGVGTADGYCEAYYDAVRAKVKSDKGVLNEDSATAYERVSMNLRAMGKDPTDVEGYDLMKRVDNYRFVSDQGINAEMYALISANYVGYELKNEEKYLEDIVKSQAKSGAFGMNEEHPDVDMTAMALQALSFYVTDQTVNNGDLEKEANDTGNNEDKDAKETDKNAANDGATHEMALGTEYNVDGVIDKAIDWLSNKQEDDGSYGSSESTSQVIIALGALGMDPLQESDFVKDGKTLLDGLMEYREGKGFCHAREDNVDAEAEVLSTEQALMALDQLNKPVGESILIS